MRPTLLGFRSVKEKTPSSYEYTSTYDGRTVSFSSPKGNSKRSSFSLERRFIAYDIISRRTGYRVGPGSYSPELYKEKIKGGSPYKDLHNNLKTDNNGYYMVGNSLQFEPGWLLTHKKKFQKVGNVDRDCTYLNTRAVKSSATTNNSLNLENELAGKAEKILPYTPRNPRQRSKKIKRVNKSMKINHLLRKRFN